MIILLLGVAVCFVHPIAGAVLIVLGLVAACAVHASEEQEREASALADERRAARNEQAEKQAGWDRQQANLDKQKNH